MMLAALLLWSYCCFIAAAAAAAAAAYSLGSDWSPFLNTSQLFLRSYLISGPSNRIIFYYEDSGAFGDAVRSMALGFSLSGFSVSALPVNPSKNLHSTTYSGLNRRATAILITQSDLVAARFIRVAHSEDAVALSQLDWLIVTMNNSAAKLVGSSSLGFQADSEVTVAAVAANGAVELLTWNGARFEMSEKALDSASLDTFSRSRRVKGRRSLEGYHFSVAVFHDPPFVIIKNDGNKSSAEGWLVDIWNDLLSQLRFTSKFYQPSRRSARVNRTKVSAQELSSGRAEVVLTPAVPRLGNFHSAEFTYPLATLRLRFLIHRSSTVSGIGQFVQPFSPFLWYSVIGLTTFSALLMGTAYTLARRIGLETQEAPIFELRESLLIIFSSLLQQGTDSSPNSLSGRIILWCSYTFGVVIYTAYSAALISKLAVREVDFPFRSLDQMLASSYRPIVVRDSVLHYLIKEGETGSWKSLRERKPSVKLVEDVGEAIDELMRSNERLTLLDAHERFGPMVQQSPYDCELLVMPGHELLPVTLMLQKSSPFKKAFNQVLLRMLETGRLSRARQRWLFLVDEDPCPLDSTLPSFALKHVTLPFLIFLAGIASSFLIFIIENLVHCAKRK